MTRALEKRSVLLAAVVVVPLLAMGSGVLASDRKLPVENGKEIVARIEGEPITASELRAAMDAVPPSQSPDVHQTEAQILNRLINQKLMLQEARRIGLYDLPQVRKMVEAYSRQALREVLLDHQAREASVTAAEVEPFYKDAIRQYKVASVLFEKAEDAEKLRKQLEAGGRFEDLAESVIREKRAKGSVETSILKAHDLLPEITAALSRMKAGETSPVIKMAGGFTILKLAEILYPDDPEANKTATEQALRQKRGRLLEAYVAELEQAKAVIHENLLDEIDFETGFETLLKDTRVLAEIKDAESITVADLADALRHEFYHGVEKAIAGKKINARKNGLFRSLLKAKLLRREAVLQGLDKAEEYQGKLKEYEDSVVFGVFVEKAVAPDVKLDTEELKRYYNAHVAEYSTPEMMRINCIAFHEAKNAESALETLRKGAEFSWLKANAEGQIDSNTQELLDCEGKLVTTADLSEGIQKALSNARTRDYRVYASPEGFYYVFYVQELMPAKPRPFEEVRQEVMKTLFDSKLKAAVENWAGELRKASKIEVYWTESHK